jgi:hypothetical protein
MSTVTIVVVGIWNALLLTALAAAIHWRQRLLQWITELDRQSRNLWELGGFAALDGQPLQESVELRLLPGAGGAVDLPYVRLAQSGRVEVHPLAAGLEGNRAGRFARSTWSPR